MADQRHAVIPEREQGVDQPADPGPVGRRPHQVAGLGQEIVAHLDIRQMAEHHAMRVQRALWISRGARGVDDQGGIVGRGIDGRKIRRCRLRATTRTAWCRPAPVADDVEFFSSGSRSRIFASFSQPALVGDDGLGVGIRQAEFQRVLAEQREQRHRDHAGTKRRQMRDRQFQRLRQEHRDAVAAHKAVGLQHIGKTARQLAHLVERGARARRRPRRHRSAPAGRCRRHGGRSTRSRC